MNDEPRPGLEPSRVTEKDIERETTPGGHQDGFNTDISSSPPAAALPLFPGPSPVKGTVNGGNNEGDEDINDDKNDSEAETIVLPTNQEGATEEQKNITKHEEKSNDAAVVIKTDDGVVSPRQKDNPLDEHGDPQAFEQQTTALRDVTPSTLLEGGNSSNLSSTVSSPGHGAQSSQKGDSESNRSRSSPPNEENMQARGEGSRKRKLGVDGHDDSGRQRRSKTAPSSDGANVKERRGTRSITHQETRPASDDRSASPPSRSHRNTHSVSNINPELHNTHKRRKAPPAQLLGNRSKDSEDTHPESDDSGSAHGPNHLRKFASADTIAMSPAKVPHKKHRDKNGRTWLARACAAEEVEAARVRLQDRPEDLNVPDYAGNTPLQIASLEGNAEIVAVLLEAGCDLTCMNIDKDTPLIDAVENGHLDVVKLLLKAGADPRQGNAKGEDPLDLLNPDKDHYEAIRDALVEAKEDDTRRKLSEDNNSHVATRGPGTSSRTGSTAKSRDSPPPHGNQSPPPVVMGQSRRTARSEATRNDLLYISPTLENLRDKAGKGDMAGVDHILNMRPEADTESVLAAARGGHEPVLQLLIAIGKPKPDPEPLRLPAYKPGFNTPMLAAIGRGNVKVIQLLLAQPDFDPTRRLHQGMTYYDIAKERQGSDWQEEVAVLKEAFDKHSGRARKKGGLLSPRKTRDKTTEIKRRDREGSSSPRASAGARSPTCQTKDVGSSKISRTKEVRRASSHDKPGQESTLFQQKRKHLRVPEAGSRESSAVVSDRETTPLGPPKLTLKSTRSVSDADSVLSRDTETTKPKRKLVSGKVMRSDQEKKRRASLISEPSSASSLDHPPARVDETYGQVDVKREISDSAAAIQNDSGKKRNRMSVSPHSGFKQHPDVAKTKKRRRVGSDGHAIEQDPEQPVPSGAARVARMIAGPGAIVTNLNQPGSAPVAFMGGSVASPIIDTPIHVGGPPMPVSPISGDDEALQRAIYLQDLRAQKEADEESLRQQRHLDEQQQQALRDHEAELARIEAESRAKREQAEAEQEKLAKAARDEADSQARIAREEDEALLEQQRRVEEISRQARIEREEEEARVEKKRRDEETQRRRAEQERLRREEQDRRRAEHEERERKLRIQRQEEEERQRREALPNSLRRAAVLSPEEGKSAKEILKWLPLFTVTSAQLDPGCDPQVKHERWIPNFQAAPIMAIKDLDLSQCKSSFLSILPFFLFFPWLVRILIPVVDTAWQKRTFTDSQRMSIWRVTRRMLAEAEKPTPLTSNVRTLIAMDEETRVKFFAMEHLFWIKLSDFTDIVPRYPHLAGLTLRTQAAHVESNPLPTSIGRAEAQLSNGIHPLPPGPTTYAPTPNGVLTNGYH